MVKAQTISVEGKSREGAEKLLDEEFNKWMEANGNPEVIHFFEPVRKDFLYGDHNYNRYATFFWRTGS